MTLDHIRSYYRVPAKRGQKVRLNFQTPPVTGHITGAKGSYIRVRCMVDGKERRFICHPTWQVTYID